MDRFDLPCDDKELFAYDVYVEGERPPLERLYGAGKPCPTALITPYEGIAQSIVGVLNDMGMHVPEDVSVVCLNGPDRRSEFGGMDFTTAVPPLNRMVDMALRILTEDSLAETTRHYILQPHFHIGRTSAPPRKRPKSS